MYVCCCHPSREALAAFVPRHLQLLTHSSPVLFRGHDGCVAVAALAGTSAPGWMWSDDPFFSPLGDFHPSLTVISFSSFVAVKLCPLFVQVS